MAARDLLVQRTLDRLGAASDWAAAHGVKLVVGEFGVPVERDARWYALAREVYAEAGRRGVPIQWWCARVWGHPGYHLAAWDSAPPHWDELYPRLGAALATIRATSAFAGVNVCGPEFGMGWLASADRSYSHRHPGTHGVDYWYPTGPQWAALRAWGVRTCRLPIAWERLQPALGGPLAEGEFARLRACLDAALAAGVRAIPALWGHGNYLLGRDDGSVVYRWLTLADGDLLADFWSRLAGALRAHRGVAAWDLLNEPCLGGEATPAGWLGGEAVWGRLGQRAVAAIRAARDTRPILMPSGNWSQAGLLPNGHPDGPWWDDQRGVTRVAVHLYADTNDGSRLGNGNGAYERTYDEELTLATIGR